MSKRQKPTLTILAGAVILAAVGTYTMLQNEQQQPEKIQSMNQTPEEKKSVTEKIHKAFIVIITTNLFTLDSSIILSTLFFQYS